MNHDLMTLQVDTEARLMRKLSDAWARAVCKWHKDWKLHVRRGNRVEVHTCDLPVAIKWWFEEDRVIGVFQDDKEIVVLTDNENVWAVCKRRTTWPREGPRF